MRKKRGRFGLWFKLAMLLCFMTSIIALICFAVLMERRRIESMTAVVLSAEAEHHKRLVEALEIAAPEPPPDLVFALDTIHEWRSLFQRKKETVDGDEWDAVLDLWYDAAGWDNLTSAEVERLGAFLDDHREFIDTLRRVAAIGGPVEGINPDSLQQDREHLRAIRDCARLLRLDAIYHARTGDMERAVQLSVAGFQLADALATEPYWLAQGTRTACVNIAYQTLLEAFQPGTLSPGETAQLIHQAREMADRNSLTLQLQSSLHESKLGFDQLLDEGWAGRNAKMWKLFSISDSGIATRGILAGYASPLGRPWLDRDIAKTMNIYQHALEVAHLPYYEAVEQLDMDVEGFSPYARIMDTLPLSSMRTQAHMEVQLQLLQIGLTLERSQAETGDVPASLDALPPAIPEETLIDPFTGGRFAYRSNNSSILLYSAGPNQTDDGGRHDSVRGDIVWRHD